MDNKEKLVTVRCDDMRSLVISSNKSREIMDKFVEKNNKYTYDLDINHDELIYDIFLSKKETTD